MSLGHTLGDEVVAVWRALEMWGLLEQPVHVYLNYANETDPYRVLNLAKPPMLASAGLLYTSPSPRDRQKSRMPSSA